MNSNNNKGDMSDALVICTIIVCATLLIVLCGMGKLGVLV